MTQPVASPPRPATARTVALAVAVVVAVLAVAVGGVRAQHYTASESAFCTSCHTDLAGKTHGEHSGQPCQACHVVSPSQQLSLAASAVRSRREGVVAHGATDATRCASCHDPKEGAFARVAATDGHRGHGRGGGGDCLRCHGEHKEKRAVDGCTSCHEPHGLHVGNEVAAGADACTNCHAFSAKAASTVESCARCHEAGDHPSGVADSGDNVLAVAVVGERGLHGDVDCKSCHDPHLSPEAQRTRGIQCGRCHHIELPEGPANPVGHLRCEGCHKPHAAQRDAVVACATCHETESRMIATMTAAAGAARGIDPTTHKHANCGSCHKPHRWAVPRAGCAAGECHGKLATEMQEKSPPDHRACSNCHVPHAPLPGAEVCAKCHDEAKRHGGAPAAHQRCAACHDQHLPIPNNAPGACGGCHMQKVRELASAKNPKHGQLGCAACHTPHGNPLAMSAGACGRCHQPQTQAAASAGVEAHQRCASCHRPHEFTKPKTGEPCAGCHKSLVLSSGVHRGDCKQCHTAHGPPKIAPSACVGCHKDVDPAKTAHARCDGCHKAHTPASAAVGGCEKCHAGKTEAAKTWPAGSPHQQSTCASCHRKHDVRVQAACGSCHADEATKSKGSKHKCSSCHAPHQPAPASRDGWWGRCASCHAPQTSAVARRGAKHSKCQSCHGDHKTASPPGCQSCHGDIVRVAAHARPEHQQCKACHDTHSGTVTRDRCLSCHTKMKDHQPTAPRCQACHPFTNH